MDKKKLGKFLFDNKVVLLFLVLCIGATIASKQSLSFVFTELFTRISRNAFIVLSLIIPVVAGLGLNFGIVIGAMSAQIALFLTTYWGLTGITGFMVTALLATPISVLFGFLVGKLFNQMKGNEMIGGLVLGYFADGVYQFIFLFVFGGLIAMNNPTLMIPTGIGVKNTIDLKDTIKYSLDTVPMLRIIEIGFYLFMISRVCSLIFTLAKKETVKWRSFVLSIVAGVAVYAMTFVKPVEVFLSKDRLPLVSAIELGCLAVVLWNIGRIAAAKIRKDEDFKTKKALVNLALTAIIYGLSYIPQVETVLRSIQLPVMTYLCIGALCVFNNLLLKTRLGQNMRTVGQSRVAANAAGINVDQTRIIAMIFSTVLASWGQLIYLQNVGTLSTYGAHNNVGQFAIAALLVGGASIQKANNKQALLGIILFHTLFIVSPLAGKELFGDAAIGEYFRVFVSYGVIAMALAMHAWKKVAKPKNETSATPNETKAA